MVLCLHAADILPKQKTHTEVSQRRSMHLCSIFVFECFGQQMWQMHFCSFAKAVVQIALLIAGEKTERLAHWRFIAQNTTATDHNKKVVHTDYQREGFVPLLANLWTCIPQTGTPVLRTSPREQNCRTTNVIKLKLTIRNDMGLAISAAVF